MQGGTLIYGNDPVMDISDIVDQVNKTKTFSKETIDRYLFKNRDLSAENLNEYLKDHDCTIVDNAQLCTPERKHEIEEYWREHLPDEIRNTPIISHPIFTIG